MRSRDRALSNFRFPDGSVETMAFEMFHTAHDTPQPLETRELPLLGSIPAGSPSESQDQLEMFAVLRHQWSSDYYCLRLSYDSMEPTLKPGDIVLVHYRPDVSAEHVQGRICACLVDGQPTLKRLSVELETQARHDTDAV